MTYPTRMILIAALILGLAGSAAAQEAAPAAEDAAATVTTATETVVTDTEGAETAPPKSSYEIRSEFSSILRQTPSEVASIFLLDPTMLSNEAFLASYPAVAEYIAAHPQIHRNPRYYLAEFASRPVQRSSFDDVLEGFAIILSFGSIAFALMWLVRTTIEQKRWNRLSRQQSEVHNKILDRFGTSSELLEYVRSPAGTKFLESAPIPLHAERPVTNRPMGRVVWTIQIGVIVAAAAIGMLIVGAGFDESGEGFFAMGAILLSIGIGFIGSAAVSLLVSRKLGLWDEVQRPDTTERLSDPGSVR